MSVSSARDPDLYSNAKHILAPMVRAGRTPLRLLALEYGADLVYTEEIVDHKLLSSRRSENVELGTVDYILGDEVVLRVAAEERAQCVLQIGTNSAENAARICQLVGPDVAAVDLNMGCPKPFSVHAGMGAALLGEPEKVKEILSSMVSVSPVPVSCKIRVLDSHPKTMEFVRMIERCGVSALVVHGRQRNERPRNECRIEEIREICRFLSIPVIANGGSAEIRTHADIEQFRVDTGASSVMLARRAFTNPSIFRTGGLFSVEQEIANYLKKVSRYDENYTNTKYVVQRILGSQQEFDPRGRETVAASSVGEICRIWGIEDGYRKSRRKPEKGEEEGEEEVITRKRPRSGGPVELKMVDNVLVGNISFPPKRLRGGLHGRATPKCVLKRYCMQRELPGPAFQNEKRTLDNRFMGTVCVNGKMFGSSVAQPNIKMAEQVAALVALYGLDIRHNLEGDWDE